MKIHWYELLFRGISPGCMPRDSIAVEHAHTNYRGFEFGAVAYSRKLTDAEISRYELKGIETVRELYDFERGK